MSLKLLENLKAVFLKAIEVPFAMHKKIDELRTLERDKMNAKFDSSGSRFIPYRHTQIVCNYKVNLNPHLQSTNYQIP